MNARRPLGPCNVLTVAEAVAELRMRRADALEWLRERGLIRQVRGRQRVIAGALVRAIEEEDGPAVYVDPLEDNDWQPAASFAGLPT